MKLRSRIDFNLLAVFEAIYAREGVTAAARQLNLSQSAVSHALARLRDQFDDPLFVRAGNALVPTALARSMVAPVRAALHGVERVVAAARIFDPATSTRAFRIGLRQSSEVRIFADLVARAKAAAPGITLASADFRRSELTQTLAEGALDMAIDVPSEAAAGLCHLPLETGSLVVAARRGHPQIDGAIDLATYLAVDHVVASPRPSGLGIEDEALAAIGVARRIAVRCQHIWSAWQIVAESDMVVTLMRAHAASLRPLADNKLVAMPFDIPARPLQLHWHEASARDPGNEWLRGIVASCFRSADMKMVHG